MLWLCPGLAIGLPQKGLYITTNRASPWWGHGQREDNVMKYDFDQVIDRRGTHSVKWEVGKRICVPCPRSILQEAMERISAQFEGL